MGSLYRKGFVSLLLVFAAGFFSPASAFDFSKTVKEIKIEGNQRANTGTIRFYIHSKKGDTYSVLSVRDDIKRIYNLGYFDDISMEIEEEPDGLTLVFVVKEKPFVRSVKIVGNDEIPEKDLLTAIELKKGSFYQGHVVLKDIQRIKKKYLKKGFYFTEVTPVTTEAGKNQIDVTYKIEERQRVKIGKITFKGNKFFNSMKLAEQIETKELTFWTSVSEGGNYQKESLKTDLLRLESYYRDFGFLKARVEEPRVEVDKENGVILIALSVFEGEQYRVGKITVEGDFVHTAEEIREKITLKTGDIFNQSKFRSSIFKITDMYANRGYAFANPLPEVREHPESKTADIHLKVDPGQVVYIGKITLAGNFKTRDNVLRREFRLLEGERFSSEKLSRSRQRLQNTGFFSTVEIEQKSGLEPDLMDLHVVVVEKETGQIRAGVGYSSLENASVQASVSETNFLGTGKTLSFSASVSSIRHDYSLGYTEPHFKDRDISLGYTIYDRQMYFQSFITETLGGGFTFGRGLAEYTSASVGYKVDKINFTLNPGYNSVIPPSQLVLSQVGTHTTSSMVMGVATDTRDNKFNPTNGYRVDLNSELAGGPFGADENLYKLGTAASRYFPLPADFVIMFHGAAKFVATFDGSTLPLFENYFLGGNELRGFTYTNVGPLDGNLYSVGGDSTLLFNVEMSYNFTKAVEGVWFYDRGQVYGPNNPGIDLQRTTSNRFDVQNMRNSVGFGIRFTTPAMPIWVSWGFKLDKRPEETPMEFLFTLGGAF
ncbi:MAG: outer membrane protein assembly factor BamA [Nitrospinae bacterium]|nr:outer membrane protein assembly factor BamA [Nitrospinota bacterium]